MDGPRILITGASSGIGAALSRRYALRNARLALIGRNREALAAVAHETGASTFPGNVADPATVTAAVDHARSAWGGLDVVIANAGYALSGPLAGMATAEVRRQFETNVFGVLTTIEHTLPLLRASRGRLAIMGSVAGTVARPGTFAYAMSKAALRPLAEGLRLELAASGVSVTLITPGLVVSNIRRRDQSGNLIPTSATPPSRLAMPTDIAAQKMLHAIDRRQREAVITLHGKALLWAARWFPGLVRLALARSVPADERAT